MLWEHYIKNQDDFNRQMDYICWNPIKYGLVARVVDWQYSTFHRDVRRGIYSPNWGGNEVFDFDKDDFGE